MNFAAEPLPERKSGRSSAAVDNLRAIVILLVLLFHSVLAYLQFLPHHPFSFDGAPMMWRAFPIVDNQRWIGFDLFCAWLDVFLMSFFFLLSGLFAWPSMMRKGARAFLADRALRLGLPFAVVVLLLMPITQYRPICKARRTPTSRITGGIGRPWRYGRAGRCGFCGCCWSATSGSPRSISCCADGARRCFGCRITRGAARPASSPALCSPRRQLTCRWRWRSGRKDGFSAARLRFNIAARCITRCISSPASRSGPAASSAVCWRRMARWRDTGDAGSSRRCRSLCCGRGSPA